MSAGRPSQAARHRDCLLSHRGPCAQRDAFLFGTKPATARFLSIHRQSEEVIMCKAILKTSRVVAALAFTLLLAQTSFSYSVLTHQAIIDSSWKESIRPLLLKRF